MRLECCYVIWCFIGGILFCVLNIFFRYRSYSCRDFFCGIWRCYF